MAPFQQTQRRTTLQEEEEFAEQSFDVQEFQQLISSSDSSRIEHLGEIHYAINNGGTYE